MFVLFGLGILLYLGIFVNYYLLSTSIPIVLNWLFVIGIILLIVLELILCYVKYGNYVYEFHEQRIVVNDGQDRSIPYTEIKHLSYSTNFLDGWFKTGSIVLELRDGQKVKLKYLNNPNQAYVLIQKSGARSNN
jgi:membrane protein YdbS with pleckstrin-like domain